MIVLIYLLPFDKKLQEAHPILSSTGDNLVILLLADHTFQRNLTSLYFEQLS